MGQIPYVLITKYTYPMGEIHHVEMQLAIKTDITAIYKMQYL